MTTIVKVGKTIAIDSRITEDGTLLDDTFKKYIEGDRYVCLFTGAMCNFNQMIKALKSVQSLKDSAALFLDTTMYVFDKTTGHVDKFSTDPETKVLEHSPVSCHTYCGGSGRKYAYGAIAHLKLGPKPYYDREVGQLAVKAASQCDIRTGGTIRSWTAELLH